MGNRLLGTEVADWIGTLQVPVGEGAGSAFRVQSWQRRVLQEVFRPGVSLAAVSVSRGNGKTTLAGCIAACAVAGPLARPREEVCIVGPSFGVARETFDVAVHVLEDLHGGLDRKRWRLNASTQRCYLEDRRTGARLRTLGSEPRRLHGIRAARLVVGDEPSKWGPSGEAMFTALRTTGGKVPGFRFLLIGTRPADPGHWYEGLLRGGADYAFVAAADPEADPFSRREWKRANPSWAALPVLQATIAAEAKAAKADPALLHSFRALRLNGGVSEVQERALLDPGTWERIEVQEPDRAGGYILGLDLGTSAAMSAAASYYPETGALFSVAAFPELPSLGERGVRDGVGSLYRRMAERGELVQCGRRAVEIEGLLAEVERRWGAPECIVADRWRADELLDCCERAGFPVGEAVFRGQGFRDGGEDVRQFRRAALSGKLNPERSLLLRSAMAESRVVGDPAGNEKLARKAQGGRRELARDDAAAASILAVAEGYRRLQSPPAAGFVYHGPI